MGYLPYQPGFLNHQQYHLSNFHNLISAWYPLRIYRLCYGGEGVPVPANLDTLKETNGFWTPKNLLFEDPMASMHEIFTYIWLFLYNGKVG